MAGLLPVGEARARILDGVVPVEQEVVPLAEAFGRVLAEPLPALRTQPPFDASAMDGYAVRAADAVSGAWLVLRGTAHAGHGFTGRIAAGEAIRIFTGAPLPDGADAVLIQEDARELDGRVIVTVDVQRGQHIRRAGVDFREGAVLLEAGQLLSPRALGLAAGLGHGTAPVRRRPKVAIIATGDELVRPGSLPGPDQIVATSGIALAALIAAEGGLALDLGIVADEAKTIEAAIIEARRQQPDILVTLGGASVGERDLVGAALAEAGFEPGFWKIAMRPGKPMMFARAGAVRALGLPGNPVSAHVCALLFLRPLLRALLGRADVVPETEPARLGAGMPANGPREDYVRARLERDETGALIATPFDLQDSSVTRLLAQAGALIIRPPHAAAAEAGNTCAILRLGVFD